MERDFKMPTLIRLSKRNEELIRKVNEKDNELYCLKSKFCDLPFDLRYQSLNELLESALTEFLYHLDFNIKDLKSEYYDTFCNKFTGEAVGLPEENTSESE